jgi:hypothetical protein
MRSAAAANVLAISETRAVTVVAKRWLKAQFQMAVLRFFLCD